MLRQTVGDGYGYALYILAGCLKKSNYDNLAVTIVINQSNGILIHPRAKLPIPVPGK
ncbi:hypothetical protein GCM10011500_12910 [Mucilaginibacter rubeus]|nr:hypothetical protein GCM10011500_12910 [Mucilaginibacter rubeus]